MLTLTGTKVAIQAIFDPDRSPGGIIIPDVAKERCDQGIVKYVGPKVKTLAPGDYVIFGGYDGTTLQMEGEGVLILLRESFVKCILHPADTTVPGLYFKGRYDVKTLREKIQSALIKYSSVKTMKIEDGVNSILEILLDEDPYFEATYEGIIQLVADMWANSDFRHKNGIFSKSDPRGINSREVELAEDDDE